MIRDQQGLIKIIRILILVTVVLVVIGLLVLAYQLIRVKREAANAPAPTAIETPIE